MVGGRVGPDEGSVVSHVGRYAHFACLSPFSNESFRLTHDKVYSSLLKVRRIAVPGKQLADFDPHLRSDAFLAGPVDCR